VNEVVKLERHGVVAIVTINNPPVNALSAAVRGGILECMKSAIAVPLRLHRRADGTLVVRSYTARNFEEEHVHLLQLLAAQLAPILDGARLHAESERRRTEAEGLARPLCRLHHFQQ